MTKTERETSFEKRNEMKDKKEKQIVDIKNKTTEKSK